MAAGNIALAMATPHRPKPPAPTRRRLAEPDRLRQVTYTALLQLQVVKNSLRYSHLR